VVVIGGSAGALAPLRQIIGALPEGIQAAVCVVVHMPDDSPSALANVLARAGPLSATFAEDGEALRPGQVVVAPPGHHLLIRDGHVVLSRGARENRTRPAIDPLFRSAAAARGPGSVSVLLSGTLDDGRAGTAAVRRAGGVTLAQDPAEASFPDMPQHAIRAGVVDEVLPAAKIGRRVAELVAGRIHHVHAGPANPPDLGAEPFTVDRGLVGPAADLPGDASPYSCPACGGVLYEPGRDGNYLCRLGHRYSSEVLGAGQEEVVEDALWTALRTLDEAASLAERVRDRATAAGDRAMELRFEARRAGAQARADRIRALLRGADPSALASLGDGDELASAAG
jgi:two-component system chemotaxis response regulator CheB